MLFQFEEKKKNTFLLKHTFFSCLGMSEYKNDEVISFVCVCVHVSVYIHMCLQVSMKARGHIGCFLPSLSSLLLRQGLSPPIRQYC